MKALAADCIASTREGLMSVARMLPETSMARMTVDLCEYTLMTAVGRAMPINIKAKAARNSAGGMWRRSRLPPHGLLEHAEIAVAHSGALAPSQQHDVGRDGQRQQQQQPQRLGRQKGHRRQMNRRQ